MDKLKSLSRVFDSKEAVSMSDIQEHAFKLIDSGNSAVIEVRPDRASRSSRLNSLYWLQVSFLAKEIGEEKETVHNDFKARHLIPIYKRDKEGYAQMIKAVMDLRKADHPDHLYLRDFVVYKTSTSDMNNAQFVEYLEQIDRYCLQKYQIRLPVPDDLMYKE